MSWIMAHLSHIWQSFILFSPNRTPFHLWCNCQQQR